MTAALAFEIDAARLQRHIIELGRVGLLPEKGLFRPVYGQDWREAVALVEHWLEQAGFDVRRDAVGNVFGRLAGSEPGARTVLSGSHIDTVKQGGAYDGALGIHGALSAIEALSQAFGRPRKHLEVYVICEEEGSRFHCNFWGSRALTGQIQLAELDTLTDPDGVSIGQAMRDCGLDPAQLASAQREDVDAFVELHIEQGRILEDGGQDVGIVDTITGTRQYRVQVTGQADHAGTTPMDLRHDAMTAAAEMALGLTHVAERMGRPAVATVGRLELQPGATNVVPGRATFTVDARHPEPAQLAELLRDIEQALERVAAERGVQLRTELLVDRPPVPLNPDLRILGERCAHVEGLKYVVMPSGAGHDSQIMATRYPTSMVFVPSQGGRSHRPDEYTPIEQIVPGVRVLARMLHELAY